MSEVRMGVIGCGSIAKIAHFPSIQKTEGLKLQAVCDVSEESAKAAKDQWHAAKWYTDYHDMFADGNLDAVIIATPNNVHRNQARAAAKAGVKGDLTAGNYFGYVAKESNQALRELLSISKLPSALRQLKTLSAEVAELRRKLENEETPPQTQA